jgi:hypothetical protein
MMAEDMADAAGNAPEMDADYSFQDSVKEKSHEMSETDIGDGGMPSREPGNDDGDGESPEVDYFLKGLVIALGIIALFSMSLLALPLAGLVVAFLVGPYLAGYLGGKHTCHGTLLGFLAGMIWSSALVIIIIYMAGRISMSGTVKIGGYELMLVVLIYFFNIVFCSIGGWISSSKVPTCVLPPSGT